MKRDPRLFSVLGSAVLGAAVLAGVLYAGGSGGEWTQWGGPGMEFRATSSGLAGEWPEDGPPKLWSRDLGEGYSAILVDGGRLYTMYRTEDKEAVIALDAKTGKTVWEHRYDHAPHEGHVHQFGDGPRATPLIVGDRLYTIGVAGKMHCLDKNKGKVLWDHDLWGEEFGGTILNHGYSSSPIAYKNTIIALVGGAGHAVVAFDPKNGKVKWKAQDFDNSYSTPRVLKVDGEDQLVTFMAEELVGLDPSDGALKWRYAQTNQWKQNISMPVMAGGNHLFLSSPQVGARGLKLTRDGDTTNVEEVWSTRKIQFYHVSTVREGDYVYGSTGTMAPAFMAAVNIKTGEIAWRERGFAKANLIGVGGRVIILDENGEVSLATATPAGLEVHSRAPLLEKSAWTVPTVVGTTMFVRDNKSIMALDLG